MPVTNATTNKATLLMRIVEASIPLPRGTAVKVYHRDAYFANCSAKSKGKECFGLIPIADID